MAAAAQNDPASQTAAAVVLTAAPSVPPPAMPSPVAASSRSGGLEVAPSSPSSSGMATARCRRHPGEEVHHYCLACRIRGCCVCIQLEHRDAGHVVTTLADAAARYHATATGLEQRCDVQSSTVGRVANEAASWSRSAHQYIDGEFDAIDEALEAKRRLMHLDIANRQRTALKSIADETARCQAELRAIEEGIATLDALIAAEGGDHIAPDFAALLYGRLTFSSFLQVASPALHEPVKLKNTLKLQLPMANLQEVCSRMSWTSSASQPGNDHGATTMSSMAATAAQDDEDDLVYQQAQALAAGAQRRRQDRLSQEKLRRL